ncbi:MAG: nucleotide exchange factor GrpE [Chloroflexi bacterium]|nr:nucleotide exchange factor GrpE [Chloroflexota bacterium]
MIDGVESGASEESREGSSPRVGDEGSEPGLDDLELLRRQLEEEKQRASDYLAGWQRAQADFVNFKRRTEQERGEASKFSNAMLILNFIPVLDDMERALATVPTSLAGLSWVDGIRLIYRKMQAVLETQGVTAIRAEGEEFDPNLHEAILFGEGEEGRVIEELQRGYRLHDRVIRPAMVKVGKTKEEAKKAKESNA